MFALTVITAISLQVGPQKVISANVSEGIQFAMSKQHKEQPVSPVTNTNAPARDGNIAIREEYDFAVKAGTKKALENFILRHPDHELSVRAALMIEKIKGAK